MFSPGQYVIAFLGGSMSGGEILIILLALLMLFGSKNLPSIARNIGKSMEAFRKASRDVTDEIMRADFHRDPPPAPRSISSPVNESEAPAKEEEMSVTPSVHAVERHESDRA
jgi:TatA/E family protein of Tat protein translocase